MEILLVTALAFMFLWFFVMRPQAKKLREQQEMQSALTEGDRVVLTSGVFGTIRHMGDKQAVVELAPGVSLTVLRGALLRKVADGEEEFEYEDEAGDAVAFGTVGALDGAVESPNADQAWAQPVDQEWAQPADVVAEAPAQPAAADAVAEVEWPTVEAEPTGDEQNRKEY